ncbi:hypothetical protein [Streptomyces lavendulae]|uniref:hypothetical protein n=1 Tax=Streptomyces lavendulae TaxID=1914 RepID=UPI0024A3E2C3|nr:hypothetical protein [Streptomyces lavendulae]GLX19592.1 hypothetical protein Slala01_32360 [Streptomyces lavendulae subsp. lavendulae]GLX27087.1 hypothetical protein Slala02_29070 [Streptomyces lavendulae subsp. lavendulae]
MEAELPPLGSRYAVSVLSGCALSPAVVERCFAADEVRPPARNRHIPADAVPRLARHPDAEVRRLVAIRPDLDPKAAAELRQDPDEDVRMQARIQARIPSWAEFEDVRSIVDHGLDCTCPITRPATEPAPDWYATCATSEEPEPRRVAASLPGLPVELVRTLALDDDEEVLIRLACHHPLAPPHLLLDVFVTRPAHRPHLLTLPAFPRTGLTHLTDLRTAEGAAANPSLPVVRMHTLLGHCLNGAATPPTVARH